MVFAKLTKLSTQALSNILAALSSSNMQRVLPVAVGYVLARQLTLPSSGDGDVRGYFRLQHQTSVGDFVSGINELIPLNIDLALASTLAFYSHRALCVNPPAIPLIYSKENALQTFFGLTACFSNEMLAAITEDPPAMTSTIKNVIDLMEAFQKVNDVPNTDAEILLPA